jgi:ribonuclease D
MTANAAEVLIATAEELAACCSQLAGCSRIGLDTEFVGEDQYHPQLCLVQVATPEALFLIDPFTAGPLDDFWKLVVDPARQVIVHAGREEVRLCRRSSGQPPGNLFDLQIAAGLVGLGYPLGHGPLVSQVLGVHLSKVETLTEWRNRPLTAAQICYAFDDVRYLLPLGKNLSDRLERLNRVAWAKEEFAHQAEQAVGNEPTVERWRKLRGIGSLDRRRLAIVRELFFWREQKAAELNRPPRIVVRDDLLIEIARRNPAAERELHVVRGLAKRFAGAIVQAVERARALAIEACPRLAERDRDPPQLALVVGVLNAFLADFAARNELAASIIASSHDMRELVRARMQCAELPQGSIWQSGWRAAHVLPEVLAILDGRRAIRIADLAAETPFAYDEVKPS